jgi:hypothetical protein
MKTSAFTDEQIVQIMKRSGTSRIRFDRQQAMRFLPFERYSQLGQVTTHFINLFQCMIWLHAVEPLLRSFRCSLQEGPIDD